MLTDEQRAEIRKAGAAAGRASRKAQGLPRHIQNPAVYAALSRKATQLAKKKRR